MNPSSLWRLLPVAIMLIDKTIQIVCLCLLLGARSGIADTEPAALPAAEVFNRAYDVLLEADAARNAGRSEEATSLYGAAQELYTRMLRQYPEWQPRVVTFRIAYCEDQIRGILRDRHALTGTFSTTTAVPRSAIEFLVETDAPVIPDRPPIAAIRTQARDLIKKGKPDEARSLLLDALQRDPDDRDVRLMLAAAQCRAANFNDAMHILVELVKEYPGNTTAGMLLGTAYFGQGRPTEALVELERILRVDPSLLEAHYNAVQIHLHSTPPDTDAARESYRRFLELGGQADPDVDVALKLEDPRPDSVESPSIDRQGQQKDNDPQGATGAPPDPAPPLVGEESLNPLPELKGADDENDPLDHQGIGQDGDDKSER